MDKCEADQLLSSYQNGLEKVLTAYNAASCPVRSISFLVAAVSLVGECRGIVQRYRKEAISG